MKSVKVEKILKGSLDSIPSPSVKIQIMGGKVCLRCKGKTLLGIVNKFLFFNEGDAIEFRLPFKNFSTLKSKLNATQKVENTINLRTLY